MSGDITEFRVSSDSKEWWIAESTGVLLSFLVVGIFIITNDFENSKNY